MKSDSLFVGRLSAAKSLHLDANWIGVMRWETDITAKQESGVRHVRLESCRTSRNARHFWSQSSAATTWHVALWLCCFPRIQQRSATKLGSPGAPTSPVRENIHVTLKWRLRWCGPPCCLTCLFEFVVLRQQIPPSPNPAPTTQLSSDLAPSNSDPARSNSDPAQSSSDPAQNSSGPTHSSSDPARSAAKAVRRMPKTQDDNH